MRRQDILRIGLVVVSFGLAVGAVLADQSPQRELELTASLNSTNETLPDPAQADSLSQGDTLSTSQSQPLIIEPADPAETAPLAAPPAQNPAQSESTE